MKARINYEQKHISTLDIYSYTQPGYIKKPLFKLNNFYYKNIEEKIDLFQDIGEKQDYVIFDTETNGKNNLGESLPFQIAAIKYRNGKEVDRLNIIMNIGNISQEILDLTGFTQETINSQGISISDGIKKFLKFINFEKYIIAHNANFDVSIMNNALVFCDMDLERDIQVLCSMQMYYSLYKHIFQFPIAGSSLDLLGRTLLKIDVTDERRHQADFDCEMVHFLLNRLIKDFTIDLKSEDSKIIYGLEIEKSIANNITNVKKYYNSDTIETYVKELGNTISDDFERYLEDYYLISMSLGVAIVKYMQEVLSEDYNFGTIEYPEVEIGGYFVKRNKAFSTIKNKYLNSYQKTYVKIYSKKGYLIDFFEPKFMNYDFQKVEVNNDDEFIEVLEEYRELQREMVHIEMKIKHTLKIIKAHQYISRYSNYGDCTVIVEKDYAYNEKQVNVDSINKDVEDGIIKSIDDMYQDRPSYMNINIAKKSF